MATPTESGRGTNDQSLLARLNALKQSSLRSVENEAKGLGPAAGVLPSHASREDNLAARLRTLRNGAARPPSPEPARAEDAHVLNPPSRRGLEDASSSSSSSSSSARPASLMPPRPDLLLLGHGAAEQDLAAEHLVQELLVSAELHVSSSELDFGDELSLSDGPESPGPGGKDATGTEREQPACFAAPPPTTTTTTSTPKLQRNKQAASLLDRLRKLSASPRGGETGTDGPASSAAPTREGPTSLSLGGDSGPPACSPQSHHRDPDNGPGAEGDVEDLGADQVTRELARIVSQVSIGTDRPADRLTPSPLSDDSGRNDSDQAPLSSDDEDLSLPTVPSLLIDLDIPPANNEEGADHKTSCSQHNRKPPSSLGAFERNITARMAALRISKVSGGSGSGSVGIGGRGGSAHTIDPLIGLPSAPTFQPEDHADLVAGGGRRGGKGNRDNSRGGEGEGEARAPPKRVGFTSEDEETWCIVCLDDGTVRCEGCDGDVFCDRCWRDMHVGPAAWQDARGHPWTQLERRRARS